MTKRIILALVTVLVSCQGATEPADIRVELGTEFDLPLGSTAVVEGTGVRIEFNAVPQDSRCPPHAFCIWEGDARIDLVVWEVRLAGRNRQDVVLHTNPAIGPSVVTFSVYSLELTRLRPEFLTGESYVVTLRVVEMSVWPPSSSVGAVDGYR